MKISSKGRYAIASMIYLGQNQRENEYITILKISNELGISKIYLEQVFSLLKSSHLVHSVKGPQGGYQLARSIDSITVKDILTSIELPLFIKTDNTLSGTSQGIENAMDNLIWRKLDESICKILGEITLKSLVEESNKNPSGSWNMFYI